MLFCTLLIQNCSQYLFYLCMCTVYILVYRNRRSSTGGSKRLEAGDGNLRGCFYRLSYFSTPIIHLICVCKELSVNYSALNSIHTMHIRYTFFFGKFQHFKKISVTFFLGFRPFNQYFSLQTISYKGSETQKYGTQNLLKILKFSKKKYT